MWGTHHCSVKASAFCAVHSPRMWGTLLHTLYASARNRFIPTHVGNTAAAPIPCRPSTVHPHACGEHPDRQTAVGEQNGSSPRMWGTRSHGFLVSEYLRFIPTHVGNTGDGGSSTKPPTVHPHACGEHIMVRTKSSSEAGSSPRMWGTHFPLIGCGDLVRFIPTHVGNTRRPTSSCADTPVHPHACGEHPPKKQAGSRHAGSSPRMWGTLR